MILRPASVNELSKALAKGAPPGSSIERVDLSAFHGIPEYRPEDMTITVQAGTKLSLVQETLAQKGQWLPIDPPHQDKLTIDELLNRNPSGPRRFGYGTIREHVIGIKAVLADGRVIQNGGKVVKNVAGFDLCKLFVGSRWSLGIIIEATFKLRPLPSREIFLIQEFNDLSNAAASLKDILESELAPIVIDLHSHQLPECSLVLGFAGSPEEVDWQRDEAAKLGNWTAGTLDYENKFWALPNQPRRLSVLPSRLTAELEFRKPEAFVARAGNGIIFYRGGLAPAESVAPDALNEQVKKIFDPKRILPELAP